MASKVRVSDVALKAGEPWGRAPIRITLTDNAGTPVSAHVNGNPGMLVEPQTDLADPVTGEFFFDVWSNADLSRTNTFYTWEIGTSTGLICATADGSLETLRAFNPATLGPAIVGPTGPQGPPGADGTGGNLADDGDVDIGTPTDGEPLRYNLATGKWGDSGPLNIVDEEVNLQGPSIGFGSDDGAGNDAHHFFSPGSWTVGTDSDNFAYNSLTADSAGIGLTHGGEAGQHQFFISESDVTIDGQPVVVDDDPRLTDARTPLAHNQTASTITDFGSAAVAATAGVYQPTDADLTAIAALTTTSYGRAFLALADAAAGRTALGLGTAATADAATITARSDAGSARATALAMQKLRQNMGDVNITILSDSTASLYASTWPSTLVPLLAAMFPAYTVKVSDYADSVEQVAGPDTVYETAVTIQTGSGANTLWVWVAGWSGARTDSWIASFLPTVLPAATDCLIVSYGHNDQVIDSSQSIQQFTARYANAVETFIQQAPNAGVLLIGQNDNNLGDGLNQQRKAQAIAGYAAARGFGFVDICQAFLDNGGNAVLTSDGVHPTAAGHILWGNEMYVAFNAGRYAQPRSHVASLFDVKQSAQLCANPFFDDWPTGSDPYGETLTAATATRETTIKETGNQSVTLDASSAAASSMSRVVMNARDLAQYRGQWITVGVRIMLDTTRATPTITAGKLRVTDGVQTITTVDDQASHQPRSAWFWRWLPIKVDAASTTLTRTVFADTAATALARVRIDRTIIIPGQLPADVLAEFPVSRVVSTGVVSEGKVALDALNLFGSGSQRIGVWKSVNDVFPVAMISNFNLTNTPGLSAGDGTAIDTQFLRVAAGVWDAAAGEIRTTAAPPTADGLTRRGYVLGLKVHDFTAPTAALAMNSQKITGLAAGTAAGNAVRYEDAPRSVFSAFANVATAANTTETDLHTVTLAASIFGVDGQSIAASYALLTSANTNTKRIRAYFGGTVIYDSTALASTAAAGTVELEVLVIRSGSTTVRAVVRMVVSPGLTGFTTLVTETDITGLTLTNTQIMKVTGLNGTATAGDITMKLAKGLFVPA
jgi:lysophospholipase L1-like esterase